MTLFNILELILLYPTHTCLIACRVYVHSYLLGLQEFAQKWRFKVTTFAPFTSSTEVRCEVQFVGFVSP